MKKRVKAMALGGTVSAAAVVIMLLGGVLGLGTYAAPMIAGLLLITVGDKYGVKYHVLVYAAVAILSFILVPYAEQDFMFAALFGPYPLLYPYFAKLPKWLRIILKFLFFNAVTLGIEALVIAFFTSETLALPMAVLLIVLGNITFVLYDLVISRSKTIINRFLGKILKHF